MKTALRGVATVNYFAEDLEAAKAWYTELLGIEPYFEVPGGYIEFRIGDYQQELGIIQGSYAKHDLAAGPAGAMLLWHVDDLDATIERLLSMGAEEYEPRIERGEGFTTASVVDPFGNIMGVMYNQHYLDTLGGVPGAE
ncbi:VOC family protein [Glycomyces salinus]|uniref:VOC family protein n=1 Tax=Glycomyces salinus TaxID=980294 RepID=UPI0018EB4325|nr:VOC family protein [Glycomyces salinus]